MAVRHIDTIHFSSRTKENAERLAQEVANNIMYRRKSLKKRMMRWKR